MVTGGQLHGPLLGSQEQFVVLEIDGWPSPIPYLQIDRDSAYSTKRSMLTMRRGGADLLTCEDFFDLGVFALARDRHEQAKRDFARVVRIDHSQREKCESAVASYREYHRSGASLVLPDAHADARVAGIAFGRRRPSVDADRLEELQRQIVSAYKRVVKGSGESLVVLETPHYLIWTDWDEQEHGFLRALCERTYADLAVRFGVSESEAFFSGKFPVFCLKTAERFRKMSALLDDYDASDALGYTSSSSNGHVHVVVRRQGRFRAGMDSFAGTLIHEGTHAFLHRICNPGHVPEWLDEGLANYVAEAVLRDRCPNGEMAEAAAREIVKRGLSIEPVFRDDGPLDARYYPIAHSLVAFLIQRDATAFADVIDDMRRSVVVEESLQRRYKLTLRSLEDSWREACDREKLPW